MKSIYLSVIIPSYNETENLKRGVLDQVNSYLSKQSYTWEVIVSDDGSPAKESRELAKAFCDNHKEFTFLENAHAGKPFAVWAGIQKASGKIVLFTDMDQSTPITELSKLLPYFDQGYKIVIGSRGSARKNSSPLRLLASTVFREVRRTFLLRNIIDTQAGFKALNREVALELFPLLQIIRQGVEVNTGWRVTSFDVELLYAAERRGYKIAEVPVIWENEDLAMDTKKSSNKGKFLKESVDMLGEIIRVKKNAMQGLYDKNK